MQFLSNKGAKGGDQRIVTNTRNNKGQRELGGKTQGRGGLRRKWERFYYAGMMIIMPLILSFLSGLQVVSCGR